MGDRWEEKFNFKKKTKQARSRINSMICDNMNSHLRLHDDKERMMLISDVQQAGNWSRYLIKM